MTGPVLAIWDDNREILLARIRNQYPGNFCCIFNVTWYFFFQTSLYKNNVCKPPLAHGCTTSHGSASSNIGGVMLNGRDVGTGSMQEGPHHSGGQIQTNSPGVITESQVPEILKVSHLKVSVGHALLVTRWFWAPHINPDSLWWYPIEQLISWTVEDSCWLSQLFNWSTALWDAIKDCQYSYAELPVNHLVTTCRRRTLPSEQISLSYQKWDSPNQSSMAINQNSEITSVHEWGIFNVLIDTGQVSTPPVLWSCDKMLCL